MKTPGFISIAFVICLLACAGAQQGFTIDGSFEGAGDGTVVLQTLAGRDPATSDTTRMINGKFTFSGEVPQVMNARMIVTSEGYDSTEIYFLIENSAFGISASWDKGREQDYTDISITGGRNQEFATRFRNAHDEVLGRPEYSEYARLLAEARESFAEGRMEDFSNKNLEMNEYSKGFNTAVLERKKEIIRANPDLPAAAVSLPSIVANLDFTELNDIYESFGEDVRNSDLAAPLRERVDRYRKLQPGQPAPDFALSQPDSARLRLSDLRGKVVLIDFWASWCHSCRVAFPALKEIYAEYAPAGLEILGVSCDTDHAAWKKAIADDGIEWLQVVDESVSGETRMNVTSLYSVVYIPALVLVDKYGQIAAYNISKEELEPLLRELLIM